MESSSFNLTGKTALITGGNTGIGLGIAQGLARAGAIIAICGRDEKKNQTAVTALNKINPGAKSFVFDFENSRGIPDFYEMVSLSMHGIDILVNNAGTQFRERADNIALEDFNRVIAINLTAPYVLSQCFAREHIRAKTDGNIIMIASLMSESARKTTSPYTAAKGGIRQLVRALAVDWAEFNIRVNGIGPGYIRTEMTRPLFENTNFNSWVLQRTPMGRWGTAEDFEGIAVFLASDAAKFITGQIIYVDGGWLATF